MQMANPSHSRKAAGQAFVKLDRIEPGSRSGEKVRAPDGQA